MESNPHTHTSGKWAPVQTGLYGAPEKHEGLHRRKKIAYFEASSKKLQGSKLAHAIQSNISRRSTKMKRKKMSRGINKPA